MRETSEELFGCAKLLVSASELAIRTKNVNDLVDVHLLHVLASWLQLLTWVEVTRVLSQVLADSSSHGETRV